jgi:hypothetical protein
MIGGLNIALPYPSPPATPALPINFAASLQDNVIALAAGSTLLLPPGWWYYNLGSFCCLQFLDPVSGGWLPNSVAATSIARTGIVNSDGANWRILNPKGVVVSATVGAAGSGYVQSSTTVTAATGGSLWHAIVGGAVNSSVTVGNDPKGNAGGTNYTLAPTLVVSPPPSSIVGLPSTATALGGVQATMTCTISAGAINVVTVVAAGAGYTTAPSIQVVPNPFDPNIGIITVPVLTATLTGSGTITAVVLDAMGVPGAAPSLTVSGAGSSGTATANVGIATAASDTIQLQQIGGWS